MRVPIINLLFAMSLSRRTRDVLLVHRANAAAPNGSEKTTLAEVRRRRTRRQNIVTLIVLVPIVGIIGYCTAGLFPEDLRNLAAERKSAARALRPALLAYRDDHGAFPSSLDLLVPRDADSIPGVLQPELQWADKNKPRAYRIYYYPDGKFRGTADARLIWSDCLGPDFGEWYWVGADTFEHDL